MVEWDRVEIPGTSRRQVQAWKYLASHAGQDGLVTFTHAELAGKFRWPIDGDGYSQPVNRAVKILEDGGIIEVLTREARGGGRVVTVKINPELMRGESESDGAAVGRGGAEAAGGADGGRTAPDPGAGAEPLSTWRNGGLCGRPLLSAVVLLLASALIWAALRLRKARMT